ncbi:MAG: hypothetical protein WBP13_02435 [Methylophilaceae bacterium]
MTQLEFRKTSPIRTCTKVYSSYKPFKKYLVVDFNKRCGYTDCADRWFGGANTFHIDHFKPLKNFPSLETNYSNLVYSCSYVNILKSSDDPNNYLEPCNDDYNQHFYRDKLGAINPFPHSSKAKYMHQKLKLGLARYRTIWLLDSVYNMIKELDTHIESLPKDTEEELLALRALRELNNKFREYLDYSTTQL